jgi:hypothetical protein
MSGDEESSKSVTLYTRRDGVVKGPFPAGQITRYVLLGRVRPSDEVSEDKHLWTRVDQREDLMPEVMTLDLSIPENRERYEAARRWADERRVPHGEEAEFSPDRRKPEAEEVLAYRQTREEVIATPPRRQSRGTLILLSTVVILAVVIGGALIWTPEPPQIIPDCKAVAGPGVVWDNCHKDGMELQGLDLHDAHIRNASLSGISAQNTNFSNGQLQYTRFNLAKLSGANFHSAKLVGASFQDADLRGADFRGADLSYANLTDAILEDAKLEGAKLDHAYWIDGSLCAKGSVGRCEMSTAVR